MLRGQALDLRGKIKPLVLQGREETGRKDVGEVREEHEKIQKKERMAQRRRQCPIHPADQCFASIAPISCCSPLGSGPCLLSLYCLLSFTLHPYLIHSIFFTTRIGWAPSQALGPRLSSRRTEGPQGAVWTQLAGPPKLWSCSHIWHWA